MYRYSNRPTNVPRGNLVAKQVNWGISHVIIRLLTLVRSSEMCSKGWNLQQNNTIKLTVTCFLKGGRIKELLKFKRHIGRLDVLGNDFLRTSVEGAGCALTIHTQRNRKNMYHQQTRASSKPPALTVEQIHVPQDNKHNV